MKLCVVTGSRADWGLLEYPVKLLRSDPHFEVQVLNIWGATVPEAFRSAEMIEADLMMVLGDRYEILAAATAAHLKRIPIAHIGGGDVTEGSYDDAMRDAISRMASIHFVTSTSAMARLSHMGYRNVHLVGSPGIDYIRHENWFKGRPIAEPYVVVSYQAETIDKNPDGLIELFHALPSDKFWAWIRPNPDRGSDYINRRIEDWCGNHSGHLVHDFLPHGEFLNLIKHCDEFIGNSSAMLYEAPELGVKTRMIGKRQKGRTIPWGDGHSSERIIKVLKYAC